MNRYEDSIHLQIKLKSTAEEEHLREQCNVSFVLFHLPRPSKMQRPVVNMLELAIRIVQGHCVSHFGA